MKLIKNSGDDRVVDALRSSLAALSTLDVASPAFSAFAYGELRELLGKIAKCRIVLPDDQVGDLSLLGSSSDRPFRNRLQAGWPGNAISGSKRSPRFAVFPGSCPSPP